MISKIRFGLLIFGLSSFIYINSMSGVPMHHEVLLTELTKIVCQSDFYTIAHGFSIQVSLQNSYGLMGYPGPGKEAIELNFKELNRYFNEGKFKFQELVGKKIIRANNLEILWKLEDSSDDLEKLYQNLQTYVQKSCSNKFKINEKNPPPMEVPQVFMSQRLIYFLFRIHHNKLE